MASSASPVATPNIGAATPSVAEGARDLQNEVLAMVDRLSRMLLESYVETDEDIGPQVQKFEQIEKQLTLIGQELTRLRDSTSATHAAHMELAQLAAGPSVISSMRVYGERQDGLARLSQTLAAHYDRLVTISVNQLEGLAMVVANKYKTYCNKVIEMRRRKAQLQLLVKQKERSDLRTLERSLIPIHMSSGFRVDWEGPLMKQSSSTKLWWSTYARLDCRQKVLLFTSKQSEPPSAASKAVALTKYVLAHELPEHHIKKPAAFELVPVLPDLPLVILCADGTMASRQWVCKLQEAMDAPASEAEVVKSYANESTVSPAISTATSDEAADSRRESSGSIGPPMPTANRPGQEQSPLTPITRKFEQLYDYSSAKIDELDRKFSGTLAEQSQRTEVQLAALNDEKRQAGEVVLHALEEFSATVSTQMSDELLRISEAELEYHTGMVAHLQQLTLALKTRRSDSVDSVENTPGAAAASTPHAATQTTTPYVTPPPPPPPSSSSALASPPPASIQQDAVALPVAGGDVATDNGYGDGAIPLGIADGEADDEIVD
mmetsp:Transcript_56088/g.111323  ORF Transcript_56088/g.111323 Transcript_56088/m.111323 type:complete len:550 (-) Transcript_56088:542-2191(-)|eukprot:CAMPEP_0174712744 /NCGR_PEP_ID=MMETSP1094-20130205/13644_1 /TAXON_ID=156173 /ORGANISM="Chrysochromulina brevifilum, Strain UTEX LB 985" /LENGTH=549 /DNA_ID=CAMNT_0015911843 /DNA_START=141 /DNA_END=1790 /DNA_ORIENTATION=+